MKTFKPGDLLFVEDFLNEQIGMLYLDQDRKDGVFVKRIDSFPTGTAFLLTKLNKAILSGFVVHLLAENQTWRINSRYIKGNFDASEE